jgi:fibronectin-binding autotransporter adhesin
MREATQNMVARFQARLGWWQRTFRIPTVLNSIAFSKAGSLWLALMALVGMRHTSPAMRLKKRSTDIHKSKKYRDAKRSLLRRLIHEPLEDRQLLATDVSVVSGNLVVNGDDAVNSWAFATSGGNLTITSSSGDIMTSSVSGSGGSGTESVTIPLSAFNGTLGVNGLGGDDTIKVNGLTLLGNQSFSIDGGSGADAVTFQTAPTLLSGVGLISVSAETMITTVGGTLTTGIGPISLSVDDVDIQGAITSNTTVAIAPVQLNRPINLGTNTVGSLGLTDAELDRVTAGTIQIGDGNTGVITVSGAITRPTSTAMNLTNNAAINFSNGSINTLGGNLIFSTPTGISPASSGVEINTGASNQVRLSRNLSINISGTGVDSGYNQFNVVGRVNLNDAHLIIAGTHIPVAGQTFTVVENDGSEAIIGTFHNLPQGATIGNFLNSGLPATISYTGGSGNDVVLTVGTIALANIYTVDNLIDENDGVYTAGRLSLREAITLANASSGADLIKFNTSFANGPGLLTIQLVSALPAITGTVIIDGTSQPGYQGTPLINIHGNSLAQYGLDISNAASVGTVVKGLKFSGIRNTLIRVNNVDMVRLEDLDLSDAPSIPNPTGYTTVGISAENADSIVITGVNASGMFLGGIKISNSNSPTIKNNVLKSSADVNSGGAALYLSSVYAIGVGAVSGNEFTGSSYGLRIENGMSGLLIGDASVTGANIVIEDGTSGMTSVTSRALYLNNVDYVTIDNVDLSYEFLARSGEAVGADSNSDYLTVRNSNLANRVNGVYVKNGTRDLIVTNNNFTNNAQAIDATNLVRDRQAAAVLATGNIFTNSFNVFKLDTMTGSSSGLTIGTSGTHIVLDAASGITSATGTILDLNNVDNVTVTGVNMGYTGASRAGNGIIAFGSDNLSITGSTISNRNKGIEITGGGTDPVVSNNNLSNDFASLVIDGAIDGADADTAPVLISGNTFTDSFNALQLNNMSGISIGTSGFKSVLVNPAVDGLKTATGTIFNLNNLIGLTIDGMDLSYTGATRMGTGLNISGAGSQLVLQNFTIKNRNVGINVTAASNAEDLTVKNNDLSNNNSTLYIDGFKDGGDADTYPVNLSGNKFSGAGNALRLWNMDGLTFGITGTEAVVINNATDGLQSATDTIIHLSSAADVTIIGLDLSFPGAGQSGTAIYSDGAMNRLTIKDVSAKNRNNGFRIGDAGQDLTLINNDLSNNNNALYISGFTDGVDADLVPVVATGTKFTGSTGQTLQIYNLTGQYIGTSASIPGIIINNATDGLNSSPFVALHVYNLPNSTIDGLNLSYPGIVPSGFGILQDGDIGSGVTIQNVSATNRSNGFFLNGGGTDLTLINNDLSNNENPLRISGYRDGADANLVPVVATGTKFSGSTGQALQIYDTANQYIGTSALTPGIIINNATDGLNDTEYIALHAFNIPGSTIDGLNLAYTGSLRSNGWGLLSDGYLGANVTIQNVIATNRRFGFDMTGGGQDLTLINNDVSNNDLGMRIWNYTDGVDADTVPVIASGNQFANNLNAIDVDNVEGQFFGTAGTGFIISNAAGGLNTVTGSPLTFRGRTENTTIDGLDLSYSGTSASGNGIYYDGSSGNLGANFTIKNVKARNRSTGLNLSPTTGFYGTDLTLINNDVSNSTTGMRLYSFQDGGDSDTQPIIASGNVFTNNQNGLEIFNSPNQYIGTAGTGFIVSNSASGLNTVTGTALNILGLMQNTTIDGLDLSYTGTSRSGSGITYDGAVSFLGENVTIQNVIARNRDIGINLSPTTGYYGTDLTLINNDVSNSNTGMRLYSFQDGSDADTVPIVASGNIFNNVGTGMYLSNMSGQFIGTSGTGIIFDNNTSGLKSVTGTALVLNSLVNVTVDGLDVSWNGSATHTGQGIYSTDSNNVTVTHVTASNRNEGVRIDGGNLLNINNSTFSNNITGVTSNNVGTSSLINNNTIQANTNGVSQSGVVQVDGTSNYWGSASAPALNGSNGYTGDVNVGLNLPIAPAGAPAVPAYPPGNIVSFATTANPLEVTTNSDLVSADGSTSLREAIIAANVSGGNITFLAGLNAQTIRLTSPLPPITKQVAIDGGGLITIDGQFNSGDVFFVNGATASNSSIRGLKIKGYASNGFGIRVNGASGVKLENLDLSDPTGNFVPAGTGIQVENTSTNVMINNVNVSRTTNGIGISSSNTPKVTNVNASFTANGVQVTQSASPIITNVNASSTTNGIRVVTSANATVRDNNLNNSELSLYLNGSTGLAVGAIRGNTFSGSSQAVRIDDGQSGLIIGNASLSGTAHVVIEDGTSGMSTVTSRAIYLKGGSANATIDSLQLGFTAGRSGDGIRVDGGGQFLTIKNSNVSGRTNGVTVTAGMNVTLTGNNLSNNGQSVNISGVKRQAISPAAAAVTASGNIFTNSANAIAIFGLTAANAGLTIGTTGTENIVINNASSGLQSVTGTAILLSNVDNVSINGIDLSYNGLNGLPRSGTGISGTATPGSTSWTVTNVNASNRTTGISVDGGNDLTLTGNTLVNNGQAISIVDVTKLGPASKAVFASGNIFTKSLNAFAISNLTGANAGLTIGTTGSENIVINNASSGLQSVTGTAINLSNVDDVTIVNVDVGFTGGSRLGSAIAGSATSNSSFWTIQNVNASNRVSGISISGGRNVTFIGNNLSNNGQSIHVSGVTKLAPAVSAVIASGNTFTNSINAIAISTLNNSDLTIGTTGIENIVINNATDGMQSVVGTAISLNSVGNVAISGVDLGYTGGFRSGAGIRINAGPDSRSTIQNVNASNRFTGIQVTGGKDLTANNNTLTNVGIALFADGVTKSSLAASVIASGNTFANSGTALQLWNLSSGLTIGTANDSNIKIDNVHSGLQSNTGRVIYLSNISDVNIDGLDVGYSGSVRSGTGIYVDGTNNNNMVVNLVTATNRSTGLRLGDAGQDLTVTNNNLSNNDLALYINNFSDGPDLGKTDNSVPVIATGNTFTGSTSGIALYNMTNQVVATTGTGIIVANTDGLKDSSAIALRLSDMNGLTVSSLDLSYLGAGRSGTGIYADGTNHNMTITGVTATNRSTGFRLGDAGQDLTLTNNNLSNNGLALYLKAFSDGSDINTVPVVATGNTFTGSTSGIELYNMTNQVVATTGTGIIVANTDGLKDSSATALRLSDMNGLTVSSLDLSYSGAGRSGTGIYADGTNHNLTITGVNATRRNRGFRIGDAGQDLILTNNDLSNTNYGLFIRGYYDGDDADTVPVVASGNKFFGVITEALVVQNMSRLYIGTTGTGFIINNATDGLNSTLGVALRIHNIPYSTIDGLDLSYSGTKRSGYGIRAIEDFSDTDYLSGFIRIIGRDVTIQNVKATNRAYGISLVGGGVEEGGDDLKLLNNDLLNNGTSLELRFLADGDDADNAPFSGTGNKFTGSTNGIFLEGMRNNSLVFGNSIAPGVHFVIDGNSGLTSVSGDALYLFNVNNVTIDGVDLSYRGFRRSGTGIRANDSFVNNLTLKNVTITNRVTGLTYNPNRNIAEYLLKIQDSNFLNNDTAIIATQYYEGGYIRNSRIEGNGTGLVYNTDSTDPTYSIILDAKGNYWGPGGSGAPGVNNNNGFTSNPANKVDSSGYVATIPAILNRDYGDAPIAFAFSTSLAGFGARHIATGPMLGTIRDTEPDVAGSTLANADSITATNDEDGVTVGILTPGANATATVFVTSSGAAKLDAWIDFNRDGDWDDAGEKIANSVSVVNGSNTITFAVPGSANVSLNYARFRISTAGGLDNFGEAVDGEVEDYVVGNIYVDDNWTNSTDFRLGTVITDTDPIMAGDQWGIIGLNAFATVNGGLAAAAAGVQNQVIVNSGNYSTENANVTKAGLVVTFQEGASTLGSLDDTISTAIVNLAGITLTTGGTNLTTRFDSSIVGNGSLIKAGSGKMTLAGNNTFTGNTTINDGTLALASSSNNNIASSPIITLGSGTILEVAGLSGTELQLASGQTLRGTGTVTGGTVKALSGSTIDPAGSSTGILNTQSVFFASGSTFNVHVNGTTLAGTDYDQLNVTGAVNLGNATLNAAGIVSSEGVPIVLINNDGNDTVIGTFNGLAEKANVIINGKRFVISYQGGSNNNDVVLLSPTPINTVPGNQTVDEDVSLAFVAGVNGISVLDYDDNLSTTKLTVTNGKLTIGSLVGGASISAGANNSSTLTLSGTQTQINAALATLRYKGNQDYNGPDSLVVVSTDAQNGVDTDTISISLTPVNDAPVAVNDGTALAPFGVVPKGGSLSTGTGVLNNDSDVDVGDLLTAVLFTNVLHGSLTLNANGSFNYKPTANYSGPDSFTYRARDIAGLYSNVATVFLNVVNDAPTNILLSNNTVPENSSTAVDLAVGNLTSVDANVDDTAGFTLLAGLDEALFVISGSTLKIKAGVSLDFETRPSYRVNVRATDGSGATFDKELTIFVRDLAEIASIQINDGQVQRSMQTKLVVTFDTAVSIDGPGAFVVRNRNTNTFAALRVATATNSSGKTVATITFASGANVNTRVSANSLVDGNYELQIYGSLMTSMATGLKVDAAKIGNSSGSNDVFGDQAVDRFFRLFGDIDGDRDVDALDNAQFKPTLNSTLIANPTIYIAVFDFDGDGDIDALDNLRFRQNLNKTMPAN